MATIKEAWEEYTQQFSDKERADIKATLDENAAFQTVSRLGKRHFDKNGIVPLRRIFRFFTCVGLALTIASIAWQISIFPTGVIGVSLDLCKNLIALILGIYIGRKTYRAWENRARRKYLEEGKGKYLR